MVGAYGHSMSDFFRLSKSKLIPMDYREECESLLKRVPNHELETVVTFLKKLTVHRNNRKITN